VFILLPAGSGDLPFWCIRFDLVAVQLVYFAIKKNLVICFKAN
jgi:hypothetical protein